MLNKSSDQSKDQQFNLQLFLDKCKAKWSWYVIAFITFGILGAYLHLRNVPKYDVTANIMIYDDSAQGATIQMARSFSLGNMFGGSALVDNEIKVLKSHSVMRQTVKDLGLNISYEFRQGLFKDVPFYEKMPVVLKCDSILPDTIGPSILFKLNINSLGYASIKGKIGKIEIVDIKDKPFPVDINTPYGDFTLERTDFFIQGEPLKGEIKFSSYDGAAETYSKLISITIPDKKSDLINVEYVTSDPKFGKKIISKLIYNYDQKVIQDHKDRDIKTAFFIEERLKSLQQELNLSENEIEEFQKNKRLVDLETEAKIIMTKNLELENRLDTAQTEFNLLARTRDFISNPNNKYSLIPLDRSAGMATPLLKEYNEMILKRIELATGATEENELLQNMDEQLDAYRRNIVETLNKNYESSKYRLESLQQLANEYDHKLQNLPSEIRDFRGKERQQTIKEQLYLFLLQQREETALSIANAQPRSVIVDEAYTLSDVHKSTMPIVGALVILLSILVPTGLIFFRSKVRNKFDSRSEVEQLTNAPILGEISKYKKGEIVAFNTGKNTMIAEMFRIIRTNLRFILHKKSEKVVLVTSTIPKEGKTFISLNLATSLAMLGKKVILIEMDLRSPKLAKYVGTSSDYGLSEYLSNEDIHLKSIINHKDIDGNKIDIISAGPIPPNPSELLSVEKVEEMFNRLREEYDYIIIDSTPLGNVSDSLILSPYVDASIYVCRADYTPISEFKLINELIDDHRLKKVSLVINGTSHKRFKAYGDMK